MSELKSVNRFRFLKLNKKRQKAIADAPITRVNPGFPVGNLAGRLHPRAQYLKVAAIKNWNNDCKTFTLIPDNDRRTSELAYFKAGSYISLRLHVGKANLTRAYSLSSSPKQALSGKYEITVKRVNDGLASNFMLDHWKIGTTVTASGPLGTLTYLPIRDGKTIIALAGGSGITPFYSLAQAINDGDEDCRLVLIYGSRTSNDILFKDELDKIANNCKQVNVVYVLSDEQRAGYDHGFITADLIKKYIPQDNSYSVFMCGPQGLYDFMAQELPKLGIEHKWIRQEVQAEAHDPHDFDDYLDHDVPHEVSVTIYMNGRKRQLRISTDHTLLQSLEKNGIAAPAHCRSGECGWCHSKLLSGKIYCPASMDHRRVADSIHNYIYLCCSYPLTDLEIEVPQPEI